jgi:hypothetical protein
MGHTRPPLERRLRCAVESHGARLAATGRWQAFDATEPVRLGGERFANVRAVVLTVGVLHVGDP